MFRNALFAFLTASTFVSAPAWAEEGVDLPDRGVVFHLSHGKKDRHHVIHPLVRAATMSKTTPVLVFLDVDAAPLAFRDAKPVIFHGHDASTLLAEIVSHGGKVALCGECFQASGKTEADLIDGVVVASSDLFWNLAERTLVFDY